MIGAIVVIVVTAARLRPIAQRRSWPTNVSPISTTPRLSKAEVPRPCTTRNPTNTQYEGAKKHNESREEVS